MQIQLFADLGIADSISSSKSEQSATFAGPEGTLCVRSSKYYPDAGITGVIASPSFAPHIAPKLSIGCLERTQSVPSGPANAGHSLDLLQRIDSQSAIQKFTVKLRRPPKEDPVR